jgi:hypothetical protein
VTAVQDGGWIIQDELIPTLHTRSSNNHTIRLHWLLPDWQWKLDGPEAGIEVLSPYGWVSLRVIATSESSIGSFEPLISRAGVLLSGRGTTSPTWGWVSPTYGVKMPAISFSMTLEGQLPLILTSEWRFPNG